MDCELSLISWGYPDLSNPVENQENVFINSLSSLFVSVPKADGTIISKPINDISTEDGVYLGV